MKKIIRLMLIVLLSLLVFGCTKIYNVTFNLDNGTDNQLVEIKDGEKVTKPEDPKKEGYAFQYWSLEDKEFDFETVITSDVELEATYKKIYKVTFDNDNGTANTTVEVLDGDLATRPEDPKKEGFALLNWTCEDKEFDFTTPITKDITLKAYYTKVIKVTLNYDNGSKNEVLEIAQGASISKLDNPKKDGYDFNYWTLDGKEYDLASEVTKDITLKANYTKLYKVTLDTNNDKDAQVLTVKEGSKIDEPTKPTKEGYEFAYWTLDGKKYDFTKKITKDITLKAKYLKLYKVTINPDNGTEVKVLTVKEGSTVDKPTEPTKTGYVFKKWLVDGKKYDFATEVTKDFEIEALWEKYVEVTAVSFSTTKEFVARDYDKTIAVKVEPSDATDSSITYTSTHPEVATVDANGKVEGIAKGTTTIIATSKNGKTSSYDVEVFVKVETLTLLPSKKIIAYDGTKDTTFTAHISPIDADYSKVEWYTPGNSGGQNGAYDFTVNGAFATLSARETSRYDKSCQVSAYITNKDGSVTKSNTVTIAAEETLKLTKKDDSSSSITWKYEGGKYYATCPHMTDLEIAANVNIEATFNGGTDYIWQEHYEDKEVWLTLGNTHSHPEGFQMYLTTPGGQKATVVITVNNQ